MNTYDQMYSDTTELKSVHDLLVRAHCISNEYGYGKCHDSEYAARKRCKSMQEKGRRHPDPAYSCSYFLDPGSLPAKIQGIMRSKEVREILSDWDFYHDGGEGFKFNVPCKSVVGKGFMLRGELNHPMPMSSIFIMLGGPMPGKSFTFVSVYPIFNEQEHKDAMKYVASLAKH